METLQIWIKKKRSSKSDFLTQMLGSRDEGGRVDSQKSHVQECLCKRVIFDSRVRVGDVGGRIDPQKSYIQERLLKSEFFITYFAYLPAHTPPPKQSRRSLTPTTQPSFPFPSPLLHTVNWS